MPLEFGSTEAEDNFRLPNTSFEAILQLRAD